MFARCAKAAAAVLLTACAAAPQDLAPEVLLLSRIERHLRAEIAQVPNYTCLETISRFRRETRPGARAAREMEQLDTVQLEIVYAGGKEWYGSPGASDLSVENPVAFIGTGMIGTGSFGMTMNNIIEAGIFTYRGDEPVGGRRAVRYDYRVPALYKPMSISVQGGFGTVGEEGSIWVDPASLDLLRVSTRAVEIPPYLPVEFATMNVDYARMRIAGGDTLLAQTADTRLLDNGIDSFNRIEFTHCRSYSTSSAISFGEAPPPAAATESHPPAAPRRGAPVPPFLQVTIRLARPVSDRDAVGTTIEGTISANVMHKGKIVVPAGAIVHGRIRAVDRYPESGAFAVGLEFSDVEVGGESLPFYADLLRLDKNPRIQPELTRRILVPGPSGFHVGEEHVTIPELPGVAFFWVQGTSFTLPAGFRMIWRTRGLLH